MDEATRRGRSVLGVNVQYLYQKKLVIRTLGLVELDAAHTAEYIKQEVLKLIAAYGLDLGQIYSVTTDNGANFIKAVELLKKEIAKYRQLKPSDEDESDDESDDESNEEIDGDEETAAAEIEIDIDNDCQEDFNEPAETDEVEKARVLLGGVRCAAHTLQLTVHDCIKECKLKKQLTNVRAAVKVLRKFPFKASFKADKRKLPFLDCETRWNSSYEMASILVCFF